MIPVIETPRLLLRGFMHSDWRALQQLILWYSSSPFAAFDHPWPTSDSRIKEICRWFSASESFRAVCLKENGSFIGYISLSPTDEAGVLNLGYCFHGLYHGRGYALESCRAVIKEILNVSSISKIETGTARDNIPSCRLLEKLGFDLTRSEECAFQTDDKGNRLTFLGDIYELRRRPQE